MMNVATV